MTNYRFWVAFFLISFPYGLAREFWSRRYHRSECLCSYDRIIFCLLLQKAAVVGNWIYITGGDVAYDDDGPVGRGKFDQGV